MIDERLKNLTISDSYWDENELVYICIRTDVDGAEYEVHISEDELIRFSELLETKIKKYYN